MKSKTWAVAACAAWLCVPACGVPEETSVVQMPADSAPRQLGSWKGTGNATLGFASESGSFRINWMTRNQNPQEPGSFQLMLRSGISGRPIKIITEHRGAGAGGEEFGDDPRLYEFLVDSNGIEWTISVEETFAPRGVPASRR